ncbi:MAG: MBL fold metallo-hydrolase [Paludibacteraceae bacterium]|nr:MBL fold metallo-hydrolase [Paludibacteraceae bacterium]
MEKLTMLGVGAAMVTSLYNTCFTISRDDGELFLVDGGGGNGLLVQLEKSGLSVLDIHHVFVSHNHSDHILGIVWLVRAICQHIRKDRYVGNLHIYAHQKSLDAIRTICGLVMQPRLNAFFDSRVMLVPIEDGTQMEILGRQTTFFNIQSVKELQHGFTCRLLNGKKLSFLGDEPFCEYERQFVEYSDYLLQEAYCLYSEKDIFRPYNKHHGTVLDSCRNAYSLRAAATLLFHTEGKTPVKDRQWKYLAEARQAFTGTIYVPNDLDTIVL